MGGLSGNSSSNLSGGPSLLNQIPIRQSNLVQTQGKIHQSTQFPIQCGDLAVTQVPIHQGGPSLNPSSNPLERPSGNPSSNPTGRLSGNSSSNPLGGLSLNQSPNPSEQPSSNPSENPSGQPSSNPSGGPSFGPSPNPPGAPSAKVNIGVKGRCKENVDKGGLDGNNCDVDEGGGNMVCNSPKDVINPNRLSWFLFATVWLLSEDASDLSGIRGRWGDSQLWRGVSVNGRWTKTTSHNERDMGNGETAKGGSGNREWMMDNEQGQ